MALTHERRPHRGGCGLRGAVGPRGASCIGHCSGARSRARPFKSLGGDTRREDSPPSISAARADRARRNGSHVGRDGSHLGGAPQKKQRVAQRRAGEPGRGPTSLNGRRPLRYAWSEMARPDGLRRTSRRKVGSIGFVREVSESGPAPSVFQGKYEGKAVPKTSEPGGAKRGNG